MARRRPAVPDAAGIDDATGTVPWALFRPQEDAAGYMLWLRRVVETVGVPRALYVDRHGIFRRRAHAPLTLEEELAGGPLPTEFGRVLQELGIAVVHARSPQAKGRIERLFGTFQDRLVSELRRAGVGTPEEADAFLPGFLARFNRRGLKLHPNLAGAEFLGEFRTVSRYRIYSIGDLHPGMFEVAEGGIAVPGELYRLPDDVWARVEAGEPPHLYKGPVELEDGRVVDGILYPRELAEGKHKDITGYGGWRAYVESRAPS